MRPGGDGSIRKPAQPPFVEKTEIRCPLCLRLLHKPSGLLRFPTKVCPMQSPECGLAERIRAAVTREFAANLVDGITAELIEVASGMRTGTSFERDTLARFVTRPELPAPRSAPKCTYHVLAYVREVGTDDLFRPRRFDVDGPRGIGLAEIACKTQTLYGAAYDVHHVERATYTVQQGA